MQQLSIQEEERVGRFKWLQTPASNKIIDKFDRYPGKIEGQWAGLAVRGEDQGRNKKSEVPCTSTKDHRDPRYPFTLLSRHRRYRVPQVRCQYAKKKMRGGNRSLTSACD